ncbi:MAG: hypothetical protein WAP75_06000, partial [Bacillota bacterium]
PVRFQSPRKHTTGNPEHDVSKRQQIFSQDIARLLPPIFRKENHVAVPFVDLIMDGDLSFVNKY